MSSTVQTKSKTSRENLNKIIPRMEKEEEEAMQMMHKCYQTTLDYYRQLPFFAREEKTEKELALHKIFKMVLDELGLKTIWFDVDDDTFCYREKTQ